MIIEHWRFTDGSTQVFPQEGHEHCVAHFVAHEPDAPELWQAILAIRAVRRAYCGAIGMTDDAKTQQALKPNSEFPPDAEPVDAPSYRPEDERHIAALNAWDVVSARIYAVHPLAVRYILALVVRDEDARGEVPLAVILREMVK